ncbi:IS66 family transposase zinc-finger binding domain-containing protein [uncultured Phascolarctobacterium sp.]|uniref:IS66 family transposase zinc-finger binding domain-containing protein n=1 Tax=uncultured Phascolarctobacterium sp. TaxID=512296 RepID=UPI0026181EF1|nr:IS66 family transposase zinc-finger binding domain-containing protein [uncultured Phascolarctobacterium sp.]
MLQQQVAVEKQNAELLKEKAKLEHQLDYFMEQLRISVQRQYGKSSEKLDKALDNKLIRLFDEAEAMSGKSEIFEAAEEEPVVTVEKHTRKKRSADLLNKLPENVPTETVEHKLSDEDLICNICGEKMQVIGKEIRKSLVIIPRQVIVREDVYYTYACRNCSKNSESTPITKVPKENTVIPGGFASPEAIAHFIN